MTYFAYIIMCGVMSGQCHKLQDTYGLYVSERKCEIRLKIMHDDLRREIFKSTSPEIYYIMPRCEEKKVAVS